MTTMDNDDRTFPTSPDNKETDGVVQRLRDALHYEGGSHEPWTSGVIELFDYEATLFYENQDCTPSSLRLVSADVPQVEDLSRACSPAAFGLNNKDLLDETYRNAGKLDADKIGWLFNPSAHGHFLTDLASGLFPWCTLSKGIRFEPGKLNVYGEGSFFKAHQDTPRGEDMFGSLVVLLPVAHEGGNLRLVHRDREFIFDGQALLKGKPAASVAYVAFFSGVEHEATRVTSGHCVTITFGLYFDSSIRPPLPQTPTTVEHPFKTALAQALQNPVIKAAHQYLSFGLEHAYPFQRVIENPGSINFKGSDAILVQTLNELDVPHRFLLAYREDKYNISPFCILSPAIVDGMNFQAEDSPDVVSMLLNTPGTFFVRNQRRGAASQSDSGWAGYAKHHTVLDLDWVTEPSEETVDRSVVLAFEKDVTLGCQYHQLCVIASLLPGEDFMFDK